MSRGSVVIIGVLVLALTGMFIWTYSLAERLARMPAGSEDPGPGGRNGDLLARIDRLEEKVSDHAQAISSTRGDFARLDRLVGDLGKAASTQERALAALSRGEVPELPASATVPAAEAELKEAIEEVLAEKEADEQRQQNERRARGFSRYLLRGIETTEAQQEEFVTVLTGWLQARDRIRAEHPDDTDVQAREDALTRATEDRNAKLLSIFGAANYTQIEERLEQGRRAFAGADVRRRQGGRPGADR